ncbi:MAG: peptidoglycan D,D-transpeptidase FtsI family protein [Sedimenticolaceae bacterium]|jgi:cell division protein FtsI (penicillin-binding protein 3)
MAAKKQQRIKQYQREQAGVPNAAWRRHLLSAVFVLGGVLLVWRAVDKQVLESDFLQSKGEERYIETVEIEAHRGMITDRRGDVVAMSTPVDTIAANPRLLSASNEKLMPLAQALEMSLAQLKKIISSSSSTYYVRLKRKLQPSEADYVLAVAKANGLKGLYKERSYRRYYPMHEVFSHVVGFTDYEDKGQEGLERVFDEQLAGLPGKKRVLRDGRRQVVEDIENIQMAEDGKHLALSLDARLQYIAYRELKSAVSKNSAISGSAVVLDVKTGEVLAMVNQPGYNPNGNRSSKNGRLRNRAVTDTFEPGSTMKPFVVAAALDFDEVSIGELIDTAPGYFKVRGGVVKDHDVLGEIDLDTLLAKSSNVGAAKLAMRLDSEKYYDFLKRLGFGEPVAFDFPAETSGVLPHWSGWAEIEKATISFGYHLSTNTMQLARAYAALANDGVAVPLTLLKRGDEKIEGRRVFETDSAKAVRQMLTKVVQPGGTATQAAVSNYQVAGKTGTAKKIAVEGGYADDRYVALFAGLAPADNPRLAMVVMVDEPKGKHYYGGLVAGPVFSKTMSEALRLMNVKPDAEKPDVRLASQGVR